MKYIIRKMKGAFYAGSEKLAQKGLALRKYLSISAVKNMIKALQLSASSLIFQGVSRGEQKKIIGAGKATGAAKGRAASPAKKRAPAKKKQSRKAKKRR